MFTIPSISFRAHPWFPVALAGLFLRNPAVKAEEMGQLVKCWPCMPVYQSSRLLHPCKKPVMKALTAALGELLGAGVRKNTATPPPLQLVSSRFIEGHSHKDSG